jgi:glucosylceramidase
MICEFLSIFPAVNNFYIAMNFLNMMRHTLLLISFLILVACNQQKQTANPESSVPEKFKVEGKQVIVYTTADSTNYRLTVTDTLKFKELIQPIEKQVCVFTDPDKTFQTFLGIGGALTDASAETFSKMPEAKQEELLEAYYDTQKGIGYTIARTSINSCDFSSASYTYVTEGDKELKSFSIDHDMKFRIPFIKKAIEAAGGKLTMFVSPWSPPGFMKDNDDMLHGGKLKPEYYQTWASYYAKFIKAYEKAGIPIWGMTIQNEPMAIQRWESCIYTADDERDFLKNYLGPTIQKEGLGDKKIIVWDHNRDLMVQRANVIFGDPEASKYAWGMGFHWYESWSGSDKMFDNVRLVHEAYPDKNLMFTEGCPESFNPAMYNNWGLGETYGRNMISDFNNGTVEWTDWNILLDETGGPNHAQNFCFAPIHGNTKTGQLIYTNSYYYIGHFSKFIRPGAKRITSSASRSQLLTTAFINNDGKVAVIVMNQSNLKITYNLCIGHNAAEVKILPHSIQTLVL